MQQSYHSLTPSLEPTAKRNGSSLRHSFGSISELYVFGDLFSDTGNLFNITSEVFGAGFPAPPFFEGRYSNGELWVENLASELGVSYNFDTNFAVIGATTGLENVGNPFEPDDVVEQLGLPGTLRQVNDFIASTPNINPDGLYTVWAGTYDLGLGITDTTGPVSNIVTAVENLIDAGARNIVVPNLPDFDQFPGAQDLPNAENQSEILDNWNSNLSQELDELDARLDPGVNLIQLDTNSLFDEILSNPTQFGFTNASDRFIVTSADESGIRYDETNPGANPDDYVFFGGTVPGVPAQPSAAAHEIISEVALSALASDEIEATEQFGTFENDKIQGTHSSDNILGLAGDDKIRGRRNQDILNGGGGDDTLQGNREDDYLLGGSGNDVLVGGIGNDALIGGTGQDILIGAGRRWSSRSGKGEIDTLRGGQGADVFVLGTKGRGFYTDGTAVPDYAVIEDFEPDEGDILQLKGKASDYSLGISLGDFPNGFTLLQGQGADRELVAVVKSSTTFKLASNAVHFV